MSDSTASQSPATRDNDLRYPYLAALNEAQRAGVIETEGPVLVPGSQLHRGRYQCDRTPLGVSYVESPRPLADVTLSTIHLYW